MKGIRSLVLVSAAILLSAGCRDTLIDNTDPLDDAPTENVSFEQDVLPIFAGSCSGVGCHVGETTNGVRLDSHERVTSSIGLQYGGPIVVPGDAAASPIVDKITPNPEFGVRMPFGRAPLPAAQIELIRTWIDEGANDN